MKSIYINKHIYKFLTIFMFFIPVFGGGSMINSQQDFSKKMMTFRGGEDHYSAELKEKLEVYSEKVIWSYNDVVNFSWVVGDTLSHCERFDNEKKEKSKCLAIKGALSDFIEKQYISIYLQFVYLWMIAWGIFITNIIFNKKENH